MSNARLRASLLDSGLTPATLADQLGVDPKTVERWISQGRNPHRAHRLNAGKIPRKDPVYLWPETADDPIAVRTGQAELVQFGPRLRTRGGLDPTHRHFHRVNRPGPKLRVRYLATEVSGILRS